MSTILLKLRNNDLLVYVDAETGIIEQAEVRVPALDSHWIDAYEYCRANETTRNEIKEKWLDVVGNKFKPNSYYDDLWVDERKAIELEDHG